MIKTCHKRSFLVPLLLNLGSLETKHKYATLLSSDLAWIFNYFHVRVFVSFSPLKKKRSIYSRNVRIMWLIFVQVISIKFITTPQIG